MLLTGFVGLNNWTFNIKLHIFDFLVKELATLHDRHLNRPTLDDNVQEEHAIEIMTQDITQVCFHVKGDLRYNPNRQQPNDTKKNKKT